MDSELENVVGIDFLLFEVFIFWIMEELMSDYNFIDYEISFWELY